MKEKVDPYLRPFMTLYMNYLVQIKSIKKLTGEIEIAPLAFMRGRTLKIVLQF